MKIAVQQINFTQCPIHEVQSTIPVGFYNTSCIIVFDVYTDDGDILTYQMKVTDNKEFLAFIDKCKELAMSKIKDL